MTKVLLVEDDTWLATVFADVLQAAGFTVLFSAHAHSAIDQIDQHQPDVIVADMLLTGTTVLPLLHELQSYTDTKAIPVVLCTNMADDIALKDMAAYGVKRLLDKSTMTPPDLVAAVKAVLL